MMNEKEILRKFLEEALIYNVYINPQGQLVHQSAFDKRFKSLNGNLDIILDCCEDNIYEQEFDGEVLEEINYGAAIDDYFESIEGENVE